MRVLAAIWPQSMAANKLFLGAFSIFLGEVASVVGTKLSPCRDQESSPSVFLQAHFTRGVFSWRLTLNICGFWQAKTDHVGQHKDCSEEMVFLPLAGLARQSGYLFNIPLQHTVPEYLSLSQATRQTLQGLAATWPHSIAASRLALGAFNKLSPCREAKPGPPSVFLQAYFTGGLFCWPLTPL